jgi:hypothetical protein
MTTEVRGWPAVLMAAFALTGAAGSGFAQDPDSVAVAELLALDKAWIEAEVHRDRAALERILDEHFLATFVSGTTIDRTAFIDIIMESSIEPFEVRHEAIRVHDDAAVVIDASMDGATKYTWIAVRREGRWRVISETFTRVAAR